MKVYRVRPAAPGPGVRLPGVAGSSRTAPATVAGSTGPANEMMNAVPTETRSPAASVAATDPVAASRVRKTARAGRESGCPEVASAPAWTVIVWNVPADQRPFGEIVSSVAVASQLSATGVAGSTVTAAATEVAFIGVLNRIVTGSRSPRSVANVVVNAAWVRGRIAVGGVATVVAGRPAPMAPIPRTSARPMARPSRATVVCRRMADR